MGGQQSYVDVFTSLEAFTCWGAGWKAFFLYPATALIGHMTLRFNALSYETFERGGAKAGTRIGGFAADTYTSPAEHLPPIE